MAVLGNLYCLFLVDKQKTLVSRFQTPHLSSALKMEVGEATRNKKKPNPSLSLTIKTALINGSIFRTTLFC